jgi:hypothetical protein
MEKSNLLKIKEITIPLMPYFKYNLSLKTVVNALIGGIHQP